MVSRQGFEMFLYFWSVLKLTAVKISFSVDFNRAEVRPLQTPYSMRDSTKILTETFEVFPKLPQHNDLQKKKGGRRKAKLFRSTNQLYLAFL